MSKLESCIYLQLSQTNILFFPNWAHCEQAHWLHTLHLTHSTEDSTEFHSTYRLWCLGYHQHHSVKHLNFSCWMTVSWHFLCCASFCCSPSPSELAFHALICHLPLSALVLWKTSPHFFGCFSSGFEALAVKRLCVRACVCVCVPNWHTHTRTHDRLMAGITRVGRYQKKHSPTHTHPLSPSSIYNDQWHPLCSFYLLDSPLVQPLSRSCLVFLLVLDPQLHTPYISSPNHHLLFAAHAQTNAACSAAIPMLCHLPKVPLPWEILANGPYLTPDSLGSSPHSKRRGAHRIFSRGS